MKTHPSIQHECPRCRRPLKASESGNVFQCYTCQLVVRQSTPTQGLLEDENAKLRAELASVRKRLHDLEVLVGAGGDQNTGSIRED